MIIFQVLKENDNSQQTRGTWGQQNPKTAPPQEKALAQTEKPMPNCCKSEGFTNSKFTHSDGRSGFKVNADNTGKTIFTAVENPDKSWAVTNAATGEEATVQKPNLAKYIQDTYKIQIDVESLINWLNQSKKNAATSTGDGVQNNVITNLTADLTTNSVRDGKKTASEKGEEAMRKWQEDHGFLGPAGPST